MSIELRVKIFRDGHNLAVRIPRELEGEFDEGGDAVMRQDGTHLVLEPARKRTLIEVLDSLETTDEEFPYIEDLPPAEDEP